MPIAFKEWAVTVRALAEGEQLLTLRKGGIREENKHFELEHEQLLPLPDLRPPAQRPRPRVPPPRAAPRARGGRLARRGAAAAGAAPGRRHPAARPGPDPRLGRGRRPLRDRRPADRRRALAVPRLDPGLRRRSGCAGSGPIRSTSCCCGSTGSRARSRSASSDEYHGCRSWVEIDRDLPFEGTPVMADEEFDRAAATIREICQAEPALSRP